MADNKGHGGQIYEDSKDEPYCRASVSAMAGNVVERSGIELQLNLNCPHYMCKCLFVFLALQPIVVVFLQPGSGL
jgi:hypothetical protein